MPSLKQNTRADLPLKQCNFHLYFRGA